MYWRFHYIRGTLAPIMRKSVTILIISFILTCSAYASDNYAKAYELAITEPEKAIDYAKSALLEATTDNNVSQTINTHRLLAYIEECRFEYAKAAGHYFDALLLAEAAMQEKTPALLHMIGNCFYIMRQHDDALELYQYSLNMIEANITPAPQQVTDVLYSAATTFAMLSQLDTAEYLLDKVQPVYEEIDTDKLAEVYFTRGVVYRKRGAYNKAIECYKKAISLSSNPRTRSNAQNNIAFTYQEQENLPAALAEYKKAHDLAVEPNAIVLYNLGQININLQVYDEAEIWLKLAAETTENRYVRLAHVALRHIHILTGDKDKALAEGDNIIKVGNELVAEIEALERKMQDIQMTLVKAAYTRAKAEQAHKEELRWWWMLGGVVGGLLLAGLIFLSAKAIKLRRQRDNNRQIAKNIAANSIELQQKQTNLLTHLGIHQN